MKKLLFAILIFTPFLCNAQTKKDIFNPGVPVVFLGIDFTKTQFTKADEFTNKSEILRFFVDANNLIHTDFIMNILAKRLDHDSVTPDFTFVTKQNSLVDWQTVYSDNTGYTVSEEDISAVIRNLGLDQSRYKDHIGMLLVEENCCKTKPLQTISAVFFNVNDFNILFVKRYELKPAGFGFLNYWGVNNSYILGAIGKIKKEIE